MGRFAACYNHNEKIMDYDIVQNKTVCESMGLLWINSNVNFDNVLNGFLALLQLGTFSGWYNVLEQMIDAPDHIGNQPKQESHIYYAIYFVIFIVVGVMFMLNLFIGVIVDNYSTMVKKVILIRH